MKKSKRWLPIILAFVLAVILLTVKAPVVEQAKGSKKVQPTASAKKEAVKSSPSSGSYCQPLSINDFELTGVAGVLKESEFAPPIKPAACKGKTLRRYRKCWYSDGQRWSERADTTGCKSWFDPIVLQNLTDQGDIRGGFLNVQGYERFPKRMIQGCNIKTEANEWYYPVGSHQECSKKCDPDSACGAFMVKSNGVGKPFSCWLTRHSKNDGLVNNGKDGQRGYTTFYKSNYTGSCASTGTSAYQFFKINKSISSFDDIPPEHFDYAVATNPYLAPDGDTVSIVGPNMPLSKPFDSYQQGSYGSCSANAVAMAIRYAYQKDLWLSTSSFPHGHLRPEFINMSEADRKCYIKPSRWWIFYAGQSMIYTDVNQPAFNVVNVDADCNEIRKTVLQQLRAGSNDTSQFYKCVYDGSGSDPLNLCQGVAAKGLVDEDVWPYNDNGATTKAPADVVQRALAFRGTGSKSSTSNTPANFIRNKIYVESIPLNVEAFKNSLRQGLPVIISVAMGDKAGNFPDSGACKPASPGWNSDSGHCVLVIGVSKGNFAIQNSWGTYNKGIRGIYFAPFSWLDKTGANGERVIRQACRIRLH